MKVYVTPRCDHTAGMGNPSYHGSGETYVGSSLIVNSDGVWVDGVQVLRRDRRMKKNREPNHTWLSAEVDVSVDGKVYYDPWTGFDITVGENEGNPTKRERNPR